MDPFGLDQRRIHRCGVADSSGRENKRRGCGGPNLRRVVAVVAEKSDSPSEGTLSVAPASASTWPQIPPWDVAIAARPSNAERHTGA
jgi:hypothetical protein